MFPWGPELVACSVTACLFLLTHLLAMCPTPLQRKQIVCPSSVSLGCALGLLWVTGSDLVHCVVSFSTAWVSSPIALPCFATIFKTSSRLTFFVSGATTAYWASTVSDITLRLLITFGTRGLGSSKDYMRASSRTSMSVDSGLSLTSFRRSLLRLASLMPSMNWVSNGHTLICHCIW